MSNIADQLVLCYVDGPTAFFTTLPLDQQTGDDWNDAPYEHNAGTPYEWAEHRGVPRYEIVEVAFTGDWLVPSDGYSNCPYCVDDINAGAIAWLRSEGRPMVVIPAGTTLTRFKELLEKAGEKWTGFRSNHNAARDAALKELEHGS
jgi:hypothetical protein